VATVEILLTTATIQNAMHSDKTFKAYQSMLPVSWLDPRFAQEADTGKGKRRNALEEITSLDLDHVLRKNHVKMQPVPGYYMLLYKKLEPVQLSVYSMLLYVTIQKAEPGGTAWQHKTSYF